MVILYYVAVYGVAFLAIGVTFWLVFQKHPLPAVAVFFIGFLVVGQLGRLGPRVEGFPAPGTQFHHAGALYTVVGVARRQRIEVRGADGHLSAFTWKEIQADMAEGNVSMEPNHMATP